MGQQRKMEGEGQQREIAKSLKNINMQLSQLMSRISQGLPRRSLPSTPPTDKTRAHYTHSAVEPHLHPSSQTATRYMCVCIASVRTGVVNFTPILVECYALMVSGRGKAGYVCA